MPVELVDDRCLNEKARFISVALKRTTGTLVPSRVRSANRLLGFLGLVTLGTLLGFATYFILKYLL